MAKIENQFGGYNADFAKYYDTTLNRNYWVLGYFGGGAISVVDAYAVAQDFANCNRVPLESIRIDEILKSSSFKGFKVVYSLTENQVAEEKKMWFFDNVWEFLRK